MTDTYLPNLYVYIENNQKYTKHIFLIILSHSII